MQSTSYAVDSEKKEEIPFALSISCDELWLWKKLLTTAFCAVEGKWS
jgi:hypothetical protein